MPNHCTNKVTVSGPIEDLQKFINDHIEKETYVDEEGKTHLLPFSFNTVVPMPESLDVEESSEKDDAIDCYYNEGKQLLKRQYIIDLGLKTSRDLIAWADIEKPAWAVLADKVNFNNKTYGHSTWYSWRLHHWGTKWDCYDVYLPFEKSIQVRGKNPKKGKFQIVFDTAWSPPNPIFQELAFKYKTLTFKNNWTEEGGGHDINVFKVTPLED